MSLRIFFGANFHFHASNLRGLVRIRKELFLHLRKMGWFIFYLLKELQKNARIEIASA
jgi:hypothetical protein